jgi:N-dimethylarginine dimethylaminohydrolase
MSEALATRTKFERLPASRLNPTRMNKPAYLMNVPFSYAADLANNAWMVDMKDEDREVDTGKAIRQFLELYHFIAADTIVYLLPTPGNGGLQDLVFTANIGFVPEHLPDGNTVILSNFKCESRVNEVPVGVEFFRVMGYDVHVSPHKFEGEAELKHLHDNVYIGGYGIRSEKESYDWMEREFDMKVIKVKEVDDYLYHLDTTVFPLTPECTLVSTEMYEEEEVAEIEKHTEIIDISADEAYAGICNSVRLFNTILNASHIHDLKAGTEEYELEKLKNRKLEDIAIERGFELSLFNLSEYLKAGALLSCMIMHLNRRSYEFRLL